jgi:hypothetical protein
MAINSHLWACQRRTRHECSHHRNGRAAGLLGEDRELVESQDH